jgi:hypothetical protein
LKVSSGVERESIEREIERAWHQHQHRDRIPSEIWRQLRALKKEFEPTSAKIKMVMADETMLRQLVEQCTRRRGMARQRLLKAARHTFPGAEIKVAHGDILEISWLAPSPPVIANPKHLGEAQACTLACYCVAWPSPFGIELRSAWSLEVPDHAAGRFLQRAGRNADLRSALFEAANHFAAADIAEVKPHVGRGTDIYIPAGGGAFVCTVVGARSSGGHSFLYSRAATWIESTMLHADQTPLREAEAADGSVAALLLDP